MMAHIMRTTLIYRQPVMRSLASLLAHIAPVTHDCDGNGIIARHSGGGNISAIAARSGRRAEDSDDAHLRGEK